MTTETILTDKDLDRCTDFLKEVPYDVDYDLDHIHRACRATEQAVLQSPEIQALRKDAERIRALAREFDRARRGSGDSYMPIWNALCESIGRDDDGVEMLAAISAAMEQQT